MKSSPNDPGLPRIDLITGFLGSGKTTLLGKLLPPLKARGKIAVVVNDFGDVNIDAQLLDPRDLRITELSAGCVCCTLLGDLVTLLRTLVSEYRPDRILIEPSGVSRTSDALRAAAQMEKLELARQGRVFNLVDCRNFDEYLEGFGAFFQDQIQRADCNLLSHRTQGGDGTSMARRLKDAGAAGACFTGDWLGLEEALLFEILYRQPMSSAAPGDASACHAHSAADVFSSWSSTKVRAMDSDELEGILHRIAQGEPGRVLRAKGICPGSDGGFLHFDYLPGHCRVDSIAEKKEAMVAVIGKSLDETELARFFEARQ